MTFLRPTILLLLLVTSFSVSGQSGKNPSSNDILLAEKLKETYKEAQLSAKSISDHYEFGYNKDTEEVIVLEKNKQHLIALEHGVHHQPYAFYDDMSSVIAAGATYQNKIRKSINLRRKKYTSQEFFHTDAQVAFFNLEFETVGFQYKIHFDKEYKDVKYLTSIYFHEDIPVLSKTISFTIPSWLDVELKEMNFEGYTIEKNVEEHKDSKTYKFTITDLDARFKENKAPGLSHIYPHILVLAKSYERNGVQQNLFSSTQDLYNWYLSLVDMMEDDIEPLKEQVATLTKNKESDIEKIKSIYYWVQDNIRYIAFEDGIAGFKPDECQNVFEKKYGDCKGMANLCRQMLTIAGFDARLTWIGTKRIAYDYSLPTLSTDNHMICTVILDGKSYYLDPTESYGAFDEYAERIQGRPVLIENGHQYILESVPVMSPKDNAENLEYNLIIDGESLIGSAKHQYSGESKSFLLYQLNNTETNDRVDQLKKYLNQNDKDYKVTELHHTDIINRDDPFQLEYDLQMENKVSQFGDDIYLSIDFYEEWKSFTFDERKLDYLLPHKSLSRTTYIVEIPEGYKASEIPNPISYKSKFINIEASHKIEGNKIIYTKTIESPKAEIATSEFEEFNKIIKRLTDYYDQQITLTKK